MGMMRMYPGTCTKHLAFTARSGYGLWTLSTPTAVALRWATLRIQLPTWLWSKRSDLLMMLAAWLPKGRLPELGGISRCSLELLRCEMGSVPALRLRHAATTA